MKTLKKCALFVMGASIIAGQLYAQPTPSPAPPPAEAKAEPSVRLSPAQMREESQALRDRVRLDIQRVEYLRAKARKENDIIKLTCVNDKFIKLKAQANLFDNAHRELLGVIETDARFEAYERVTQAAADTRKAREEADVCVGEPDLAGDSVSDFTGPEIVDDPTLGLPFDIEIEPPAYASPYI